MRRRKAWGWGFEDQAVTGAALDAAVAQVREHLGFGGPEAEHPVPLERATLPEPRIAVPLACATTDRHERARHALGSSYRDVVRGLRGDFSSAPDAVALPRDETEVEAVLAWCSQEGVACVPYGGGTSVVGGVEPPAGRPSVSLDLRALSGVLEVDPVSRAARIAAGTPLPAADAALREHGLSLRFFPQSYELATVGGAIATRGGGHFATTLTHVDDLVESVRALTPAGVWESRRLPGSGAGPSPDRLLVGSEGTLGVLTEAWLRVQPRPRFRAGASVRFDRFTDGAQAARAIVQAGLHPSNCRLLDPGEGRWSGAPTEGRSLLVLGFESADHPLDAWLDRALALAREHGGEVASEPGGERDGAAGAWRQGFVAAPYLRDAVIAAGVISETVETAITWDRFDAFVEAVRGAAQEAVHAACGQPGLVSVRLTHLYPDGAAPYVTVLAPGRRGEELGQWDAIKAAASDAILEAGGTITHHHAVGRDHRPWYDRQRPHPFALALAGAKAAVDPAGVLNPGVLLPG